MPASSSDLPLDDTHDPGETHLGIVCVDVFGDICDFPSTATWA